MYRNILKHDLKRKKTMNVILLIFVILSATFMASSVNNIMAVTSGLDYFFEKANVSDCRREPQLMGYGSDIKIIGSDKGVSIEEEKSTLKTTYIMDMIIAGILLIVSVFLIIVSFVVLKHTIGFTIAEEFREIGVMKAIGMKNSSIRGLYLIKYFSITVVGSSLGFFLSIPFSDMLLKSVSTSMYLNSENNLLVGLLCTLLVVGITLLFCWSSTNKIKKLPPIDAVRSGQKEEPYAPF